MFIYLFIQFISDMSASHAEMNQDPVSNPCLLSVCPNLITVQWKGPRGCCCAANDVYQLEDETFARIMDLRHYVSSLHSRVRALTDSTKIAFKATMNHNIASSMKCFGPFNINVPLPFTEVTLNHGDGYNPSLAPCAGVYVFSFTIYSFVEANQPLYHKVTQAFRQEGDTPSGPGAFLIFCFLNNWHTSLSLILRAGGGSDGEGLMLMS
uniref:C1q domain-containing protein n=1 Tax=Gouania willdenowi TaxID=441366 RepID=A0A8C5DMJ1_GOUWI